MARYTQRPENALKRANEFIDVNKPLRALDTLQEVFRIKRWNYTYSESIIEPIMFKYLYLCVELKKPHIAKEGLFQYRNMFQLVNVNSLENVIRGYLRMAEEKTEIAQAQSSAAVAVLEFDDLDNITTPESLLMSAVSAEDAQDRSDRTILLPWVKFLWESYCQCLELLRINMHCEALYHDIARMAFQFCLKYNRKSEFRRLCDKLRKHLEDICKSTNQTTGVSITKVETQQMCLDTRLHQLDSAIQMELWLEAYKAIEDIHGLMVLSKKMPLAKTMANYYQKLAMVFTKAGNQLYHAAALIKLFQLTREQKKNLSKEDLQRMAAHVLIATLSIPLPSAHPEFDRFIEADKSPLEKAQKLAVLLNLTQPPTRASLLREIVRLNIPNLVAEDFRNLYQWVEVEFNPLNLCQRVQHIISIIEAENAEHSLLLPYIQPLKDITIMRLIREVAQVYESMEFQRFRELATFCDNFQLQKLLVESVRHNDMQIRIDHQKQCVYFGTELTESQRECHQDGPGLQSMPSEQIRSQLVNMGTVLTRSVSIVYPNREKEQRAAVRNQMVQHYLEIKDREHQRILQRQKIIEDRKEYIEKQNNAREEEEARRAEEEARKLKIAEQKRLEQEQEERERKRYANEILEIRKKSLKEKVQQISQTAHGKKMLSKLDEEGIKKLDAEQIAARESEELQRERKELQSKLKSQEKKIDYFERAKRIEEIPLFEKYLAEKQINDKEFWDGQEKARIEKAVADRKEAVCQRERLQRMYEDRDAFLEDLKKKRANLYIEKLAKFEEVLAEERKKRLLLRANRRREERRIQWNREKEEERIRKEEEMLRLKKEEERQAAETRRMEREAEEEKRRIQFEKQRAKEEEAERRIQEERDRNARELAALEKDTRDTRRPRDRENNFEKDASWRPRNNATIEWRRPAVAAAEKIERKEVETNSDSWRKRDADNQRSFQFRDDKWRRPNDDERQRVDFRRTGDRDDKRVAGERDRDFRRPEPIRREERDSGSNWRDAPRREIERDAPRREIERDALRREVEREALRREVERDAPRRETDRDTRNGNRRGPERPDSGAAELNSWRIISRDEKPLPKLKSEGKENIIEDDSEWIRIKRR